MSSQASETCSNCGRTGWLRVSRDSIEGVVRCECLKTNRAGRLFGNAKIPQRYAHCEFENKVTLLTMDGTDFRKAVQQAEHHL